MPDRVPLHGKPVGAVDRYGGKFEGLLELPLIVTGLRFLLLPRGDPGRATCPAFCPPYRVIRIASLSVMVVVYGVIIMSIYSATIAAGRVVAFATDAVFVVIGLVLDKVRPNWFVGSRTPWTPTIRRSWVRTHRAGGWLLIAIGIASMILSVLEIGLGQPLLLVLVICGTILAFGYSYLEGQRDPDRAGPGGTLFHR